MVTFRRSGGSLRSTLVPWWWRDALWGGDERLLRRRAAVLKRAIQVWRQRPRGAPLAETVPGVTIATVSRNSLEPLQVLVEMVRRHAPREVRISVADNGSTDGTASWLAAEPMVDDFVLFADNIGHGPAMDALWLRSNTTHTVALDVDAFPISDDWLSAVIEPLEDHADVAGAALFRSYVHPCYLAMRTDRWRARRHTFCGSFSWDTGELMSLREPRRHLIAPTWTRGPGVVGSLFGDVVYHNFYATRFGAAESLDGIAKDDATAAWAEAVARWVHPPDGQPS